MPLDAPDDAALAAILTATHAIALVGASANPARPSHGVMRYLIGKGYEVYPVNPGLAGGTLFGRAVFATLAGVPVAVDLVDIFRRSDALAGVVSESLALSPLPKVIWMQLGLRDGAAAEKAVAAGVTVVMDRCIRIEHERVLA